MYSDAGYIKRVFLYAFLQFILTILKAFFNRFLHILRQSSSESSLYFLAFSDWLSICAWKCVCLACFIHYLSYVFRVRPRFHAAIATQKGGHKIYTEDVFWRWLYIKSVFVCIFTVYSNIPAFHLLWQRLFQFFTCCVHSRVKRSSCVSLFPT